MNGTALVALGCLLAAACALAEPAHDKPAGPGSRGFQPVCSRSSTVVLSKFSAACWVRVEGRCELVARHKRVRRGGSWHTWAFYARCGYRNWNSPQTRYTLVGIRLAREIPAHARRSRSTPGAPTSR